MTGWNLPPGCNVSDIPGNRPGDDAAEAVYDHLFNILETKVPDEVINSLGEWVEGLVNQARQDGYQDAQVDRAMEDQVNADRRHHQKIADHIDGYDRDDLGESPDY